MDLSLIVFNGRALSSAIVSLDSSEAVADFLDIVEH